MYNIRQFKPALYLLLFMGLCGFCLGAESGTIFLLGSVALFLNAWLVWRGWFRPMPRLISNLVTIAALVYVVREVLASGSETVMLIGEFLLLLQMVKLWEQRGNRDYGQLLVLSLLLMVAAAISTGNILFGLLLAIYLFVSLYCCLLFHLKVESDAARVAMAPPERKISPAVLRQDQRHFARSMRRLTATVSAVAVFCAVVVFVLFPRGTGAGMFGPLQFKPTQAMVGFSEEVSFQTFSKIQQNDAIVAYVGLKHGGESVQGGTLMLRGVTLDRYTGEKDGFHWVRWPRTGAQDFPSDDRRRWRLEPDDPGPDFMRGTIAADEVKDFGPPVAPVDVWRQDITLLPTGTNVMFAMAGLYSIQPKREMEYRFSQRDAALRNDTHERDRRAGEIKYVALSDNDLGKIPPWPGSGTPVAVLTLKLENNEQITYPVNALAAVTLNGAASTLDALPAGANIMIADVDPGKMHDSRVINPSAFGRMAAAVHAWAPKTPDAVGSLVKLETIMDPRIRKFALDPEGNITGRNENGSLAAQRVKRSHLPWEADDLDEQIAKNIESYLKDSRNGFRYTLDLSTIPRVEGRDPLTVFICDTHKDADGADIHEGNCEYYAGAMTLICQSLGMKARMCLGFRCTEYNGTPGAGYYIVRQSHAHAWVEVFTKEGWKTFDPTAEEDSKKQAEQQGLLQKIKHLFNFLQFSYGNSIIAFSNDDRTSLLRRTESAMAGAAGAARYERVRHLRLDELLSSTGYWTVSSGMILTLMGIVGATALFFIFRYLRDTRRLRGRAARIGIAALPRGEQHRLARQLEFYDKMLNLLDRHQIRRPPSQTPLEFSKSLLFLPAGVYEGVRRLTELFYRVRYGQARLTPARQRHLGKVIEQMSARLRER
jgi:hypothetical protein